MIFEKIGVKIEEEVEDAFLEPGYSVHILLANFGHSDHRFYCREPYHLKKQGQAQRTTLL